MSRITVTAIFLLISAVIITVAFQVGVDTSAGEFMLGMGTEVVGIVITVAVVDWFFERRRLQERARQLAWGTLHAVENAVWVWQGGPRQVETDELLGILSGVQADDPVPEFTQNLLLNLGTRSKQILHNDPRAVESMPGLMQAFEELTLLAAVREGGRVFRPKKISRILEVGVMGLAKALGQPTEEHPAGLIRYRDPSLEGQEQRHYGVGTGERRRSDPTAGADL